MKIQPSKVIKLIKKYYPTFEFSESKKLIDFCKLNVKFHLAGFSQVEMSTWPDFVRFSEYSHNYKDANDYEHIERAIDMLANNGFVIIKSELVYDNCKETLCRPRGKNGKED